MNGIFSSLIVFLLPWEFYKNNVMHHTAENNDMWSFSVTSFTAVILVVTFKLMLWERYFTWINLFSIFVLSLMIYFLYIWASNYTGFSSTYLSMEMIFASP